jgi:hypothetical protein
MAHAFNLRASRRHRAVAGGNLLQLSGIMKRGRILAVKWGLNPNSSSLGVDVTFLLFGAAFVSLLTPMVGALLRFRRAPK